MRTRLRRIAAAGNAVAVALLAIGLAISTVPAISTASAPPGPHLPGPPLPQREGGERRAILIVVIDALRRDRAADPALMPHLNRLAREGGRGMARVESWIPSTVAGIRAIVEGAVPPPASFLQDFGASPARDGGIFAAAQRAGLRTFAAGPRLWADLYGPWLDGSLSVDILGAEDEPVGRAGLRALGNHDLVVVHLSGPDDAAHLHGGDSGEYRAALQKADAALGRLIGRAGTRTTVAVTSDHGVTSWGGHAGPEPEVLETPVIVRGPGLPRGDLGEIRQRDLGGFILLGKQGQARGTGATRAFMPGLLASILALACVSILGRRLAAGAEGGRAAFLLDAALWAGLALAAGGLPRTALLVAAAALAAATLPAVLPPLPRREEGRAVLGAVATGLAFGALRLLDGGLPARALLPSGSPGRLFLCAIGLALGFALRRLLPRHPLPAGILLALLPALLLRLLGETASLSTLDVRLAFRFAAGPLGLPAAVLTVLLTQALPTLALLLGLGAIPARSHPSRTGSFAAGLALTLTAQAACAAAAISLDPGMGSLATGLLVRLAGETTFWFLGSTAAVALASLRAGIDQGTRGTGSEPRGQPPLRKASAAGKNDFGRSM